jgi:hypothetical protein
VADQNLSFGARAKRTAVRLFVFTVVVALGGAVFVLLSRLNERTFTLQVQGDQLVVFKGRSLPVGAEEFHPTDPLVADAYAPIPLEGQDVTPLLERRFTERDELDRALFDVLAKLARPKVLSDAPQVLERGLYYVRRAEKLKGATPDQRAQVQAMLSELSFFMSRSKLDDARKLIAEAMVQLQISADSGNRHARTAQQMLMEVSPPAKALEESLRKAVHQLSEPATPSVDSAPSPK